MKILRTVLLVSSLATACFAADHDHAPAHPIPPSNLEIQKQRASHIIGMKVEDRDGEDIGKINNFVIDIQSGQVKYAILASQGILGAGSRLKAVPAQTLSLATAKHDVVAVDTTKARWRRSPPFRARNLAALNNTNAENSGAGPLELASHLLGESVLDPKQQSVGKVTDLIVDLAGRKETLALLSSDRLSKKKRMFAVPLRSFNRANGKIILDANPKAFEQAPPFDEKTWQSASSITVLAVFQ